MMKQSEILLTGKKNISFLLILVISIFTSLNAQEVNPSSNMMSKHNAEVTIIDDNKQIVDKSKLIKLPKDVKCSTCGMLVEKNPIWAAKITTKDEHSHYFCGSKCMLKFYLTKEDLNADKITVNDYNTLEEIDAKTAYFVLNSDVLGPMGKALIPFKDENQAKLFMKKYNGEKVLKFEELDKSIFQKK